ncbi:hypothetical protein R3P38DRAFT_2790985 [Favolaschia claudopus]|uniref:CxC2-like cysteine cluster KDZ transposase-associated domain-containing protein n=1 Tax=Favolaschia claudopus TaxID=2862362 RepID=A0AAW0AIJ8_9AGAR
MITEPDDPLRQWVERGSSDVFLAEMLRHEGRSDQNGDSICRCGLGAAIYRCMQRTAGVRELYCVGAQAATFSFKTGMDRVLFRTLYPQIPWPTYPTRSLGYGRLAVPPCQNRHSRTTSNDFNDFVIVDNSGVHPVNPKFCSCGQSGHPTVQLLRARLWPSTTTSPRTAATFSVWARSSRHLSYEARGMRTTLPIMSPSRCEPEWMNAAVDKQ